MTLDRDEVFAEWAASGAMEITGRAARPPIGPPAPLVDGVRKLGTRLRAHARNRDARLAVDPLRRLADRAAAFGYTRRGDVSCGGASRLVRTSDGWLAVTLARRDDVAMIPAWLGVDAIVDDPWTQVVNGVRERSAREVVDSATFLGLPVASLAEVRPDPRGNAIVTTVVGAAARVRDRPVVVDLSSLWAGPLCSQILHELGARVIKVEALARPDGARRGAPAFFGALNAGKHCVALDFHSESGIASLRALLEFADVVVEGSRPRALENLGINAVDVLKRGPRVWVSITGYGRGPTSRERVAFGDDAAVAGGLVVWDESGPCFCADAVADPLTGLAAAVGVLDALKERHAVLLDVAMARVAAGFAGPTLDVPDGTCAAKPALLPAAAAPALGSDSESILAEIASQP